MDNRNSKLLNDFFNHCVAHPEQRFWQALRNWSQQAFILACNHIHPATGHYDQQKDTFYWEGKTK